MATKGRKLALEIWGNFVVRYIFKLMLFEYISLLTLSEPKTATSKDQLTTQWLNGNIQSTLPWNPCHETKVLKYLREISLIPELTDYSLTGLAFCLGAYILMQFAECWILQ